MGPSMHSSSHEVTQVLDIQLGIQRMRESDFHVRPINEGPHIVSVDVTFVRHEGSFLSREEHLQRVLRHKEDL